MNPYDLLTSNQYLFVMQHTEAKLKAVRAKITKNDIAGLAMELVKLRQQLEHVRQELEGLKSSMALT